MIGANDAKAEKLLCGLTLVGAYVDEATVIPRVGKQLLGRLSVPGARLFATTNPDSPSHWLKKDYLDKHKLPIGHLARPDRMSFHVEPPLTADGHRCGRTAWTDLRQLDRDDAVDESPTLDPQLSGQNRKSFGG